MVGNSPELMPMDTSLNKDLDDAVNRHTCLTQGMSNIDPKKFSMRTPKKAADAYKRLFYPQWTDADGTTEALFDPDTEGAPSSKRIVQDINKVVGPTLDAIIEAKGALVPNLGNRKGVRWQKSPNETRGGKRTKKPPPQAQWVHPHASAVVGELNNHSLRVHSGAQLTP